MYHFYLKNSQIMSIIIKPLAYHYHNALFKGIIVISSIFMCFIEHLTFTKTKLVLPRFNQDEYLITLCTTINMKIQ